MRTVKKLLTIFTRKEQKYCAFLLLYMFLGGIFEAVGISAILPLISILGDSQFLVKHEKVYRTFETFGVTGHVSFVLLLAGVLIFYYIGKNLYMVWLVKKQVAFILEGQITCSKRLMVYYLRQPYLVHLERNSAVLLRNLQTSISDVFRVMFVHLFLLLTESIVAFTIWLMLVYIDPFTATVVVGAFVLLIYVIMRTLQKKLALQGTIQNQCAIEFTKWINQGLGAIKETKILQKEASFWEAFSREYEDYGKAQLHYTVMSQLPKFFIESCVTIGLLLLIIIKLSMGVQPEKIVPLLGVLALAAFRLMPCANRIIMFWGSVRYYLPFFDALYKDLMAVKGQDVRKNPFEKETQVKKIHFLKKIKVQFLSFRYPKGTDDVLQNISFSIAKGSFVGIVGQSGAGKTTFVDILLGLLEPTGGTILVDGQDIFQNIRGWQANLAYVPQSIYLIDGSILENIAIGEAPEEIDEAKVERALRMAELYDFVQSLPERLETGVGERGVKLSGGQRQRIGIARALYQEPEVLILDEATSALDNETEKNITDTILKLKGKITIIAIAHRMSTLENCDFKVKFEAGHAFILDEKKSWICLEGRE